MILLSYLKYNIKLFEYISFLDLLKNINQIII